MLARTALGVLLAALLLIAPTAALGAADIEGVWSFSGGQVAIQPATDGSFTGTVIRATRFADCPHQPGEKLWVDVRPQPDGEYFGGHQWFRGTACVPIPERGHTAFRVLQRADGARFLRVCLARPSQPQFQPTIAPDGTPSNAPGGCTDSDALAPPSATSPGIDAIATLPKQGRRRCLSRRAFKIRLREPAGDALKSARVYVRGKRVAVRRGKRLTAPINLRGLPKGRYTVKITATTVLGKTIKGSRKYRTCTPRKRGGGSAQA